MLRWVTVRSYFFAISQYLLFKGSVVADALYSAASIGLVAYPGQGIKRSVKAAFFESTQRGIATSLREDGQDMARQWRVRGSQDGVVVDRFMRMDREDDSEDDSDYV